MTANAEWRCDFCHEEQRTLYEGWFYAVPTNEWNQGTATAGLLQLMRGCKTCVNEQIKSGRAKAKELIE